MLSPKMLKSPKLTFSQVGEEGWQPTFDAESKNAKIPISHFCRCGKGEGWWPTFDAESRNAKIPNSHFHRWKRGIESQLLMLSPKMLKSHIHIFAGRWGKGLLAKF